jgi:hypothetical protein
VRFVLRGTGVLIALIVLACGIWSVGAVYFRAPGPEALRIAYAGAVSLLTLATVIALVWPRQGVTPVLVIAWAVGFAGLLIWWSTIRPSHQREWAEIADRLPRMTIAEGIVRVSDVRDFQWKSATEMTPRWTNRQFTLDQVEGVDLFFSYWTGPAIAHVIVSFPIRNEPPLAFSIEIRREKTEEYSALAGFFKSYELAILAAEERDVIRLRTDIWKEDVRLYRLGVSPEKAQVLLRGYAREIEQIAAKPLFYHTVTGNCTNIAYRLARELWPSLKPDWRVLLSGYGPDFAYELGAVDTRLSLVDLKERARISDKAQSIGDIATFSQRIREDVPKP